MRNRACPYTFSIRAAKAKLGEIGAHTTALLQHCKNFSLEVLNRHKNCSYEQGSYPRSLC